jgi:AcrR family transcriptional regulator
MILTVSTSDAVADQYHHGNLPEALVAAALELIEQSGVDALSLRTLAARVGVSHAAPAHHFGDKRGLLAAIAEEGFRRQVQAMEVARDRAPHPMAAFRAVGVAYVAFALEHTAHFRVMFHAGLADKSDLPDLAAVCAASLDILRDGIVHNQRAGLIREGDPVEIALLAWAAVHGVSMLAVDGQLTGEGYPLQAEQLGEIVTGALYHGLIPLPPG